MLAYSADVYFALMGQYNDAVWLARLLASLLGVIVVFLLFRPSRTATITIAAVLSLFWAWTGIAFHWFYFSAYYFMAPIFAGLFVLQALAIAWVAWRTPDLRFSVPQGVTGWTGATLLFLAMIVYPFFAPLSGRDWAQASMFGVSSATVVLFTLGLFVLSVPRRWLMATIPLMWCAYSAYVAWALPSPADAVLPLAGLIAVVVVLLDTRQLESDI